MAGCMLLLAVTGLGVVNSSLQRIERIVYSNNLKIELITQMRTLARERTLCLQEMLLQDDPFSRDENWLEFNQYGSEFARTYQQLLSLDLSQQERALLAGPSSLIGAAVPVQLEIAEYIFEGNRDLAHRLLLQRAIPLQDAIFKAMSEVIGMQQAQARHAVQDVQQGYRRGLALAVVLVVAALIVTGFTVRFVVRYISASERHLQSQKERAEVTLQSIVDGVVVTDAAGCIEHMNISAEALLQCSAEDVVGQPLSQVLQLSTDSVSETMDEPTQSLPIGEVSTSQDNSILVTRDGRKFPVEYTTAPIYDSIRQVSGSVVVFRDVSTARALSNQLEYLALHDSLTGLFNRREIEARLKLALAESRRYADEQYWLCYIDLDQFKVINDTCGHMAGDALLRQIADILKQEVRETDVVARMGGDEFAILLKRCAKENIRPVIERVRMSLEAQRFAWDGKSFNTTASMGLVSLQEGYATLYDLMSAADAACYMAKEGGRNRVCIYQRDDAAIAKMEGEMQWVARINKALEEGRFVLFYQRIESLKGESSCFRCEVMVRMREEDGSLIPPMAFIPAAERYNRMTDIDRWVVRNTLAFFAACDMERVSVSINLSAQSLANEQFLEFLVHELDRHMLDPRSVCFEITETSAIANLSRATQLINSLRAKGCRFSLDDFGSGLSSFGYLKNLAVDYLKIDGSFIRDVLDDPIDRALVESINQVGHILGMKTIAEYVENDRVRALLEQIGVDYGQGYGIAKPAPLAELLISNSRQVAGFGP